MKLKTLLLLVNPEEEFNWIMIYRKIRHGRNLLNSSISGGCENFLLEVSLNNVCVDPYSLHGKSQNTNLEYLLLLDLDNLVWNFRITTSLLALVHSYGG